RNPQVYGRSPAERDQSVACPTQTRHLQRVLSSGWPPEERHGNEGNGALLGELNKGGQAPPCPAPVEWGRIPSVTEESLTQKYRRTVRDVSVRTGLAFQNIHEGSVSSLFFFLGAGNVNECRKSKRKRHRRATETYPPDHSD